MILGSAPDFDMSDFQSECSHWAPLAWGGAPSFDVSGFQPFLLLDLRFEKQSYGSVSYQQAGGL